jgi:hypothetical protein
MAATGYNLNHLQVAAKGASPTFKDVLYATTFQPTVDQTAAKLKADAKNAVTAWSAADGGGSIGFGSMSTDLMALLTGGTASTSGASGTLINRVEVKGSTTPPFLIFSAWIPNVDGNQTSAGFRVTLPNAQLAVPTTNFQQESFTEFTANLSFVADANDVMVIWEDLATAPTFTSGVMPVNLTAPGS